MSLDDNLAVTSGSPAVAAPLVVLPSNRSERLSPPRTGIGCERAVVLHHTAGPFGSVSRHTARPEPLDTKVRGLVRVRATTFAPHATIRFRSRMSASPDPSTPSPDAPAPAGEAPEAPPVTTTGQDASASSEPAPAPTRFVFIDTEATGLDHQRHELTEVAWIVRFEDGRQEERQFFPQHTIDGADADALELTHYHDRIAPQPKTPASEWLTLFLEDATDAVLVGAVPDFDARHLELMCRKLGLEPTWDHHLLDVETLALPFLAPGPEAPRSLAKTCAGLGVAHDRDQAHGALYDAQQAMRAFDALWALVAELRRTGKPLPEAIPRGTRNGKNGQNGTNGDTSTDGADGTDTTGAPPADGTEAG